MLSRALLATFACSLLACSQPTANDSAVGTDATDRAAPMDTPRADVPANDAPPSDAPTADSGPAACGLDDFLAGFAPTRRLYVSPSGSDTNDGTSPATAWRSLANASQLQAGDQVDIAAGTYPCGAYITVHGTADHPVWIRSSDGPGTASFDCGGMASGFEVDNAKYLVIDGLEIHHSSAHVLHVQSGGAPYTDLLDHVRITHCHLHHAGLACIKANQVMHLDIVDNELNDAEYLGPSQAGQIIDVVAASDVRVVGNRVHDTPGNVGIQLKGGIVRSVIDRNVIWNVGGAINLGGATGPEFFLPPGSDVEADGLVASNNVIYGAVGIAFNATGCRGCVVANNSVATNAALQPVRGLPGSSSTGATSHTSGLQLVNNAFAFLGTRPMDLLNMTPDDQAGFVQSHNLFWSDGGTIASIYSDVAVGGDGTIVDRDPMFVNASTGDLHVQSGSPTIGAGTMVGGVTTDPAGACRTVWNIGAY